MGLQDAQEVEEELEPTDAESVASDKPPDPVTEPVPEVDAEEEKVAEASPVELGALSPRKMPLLESSSEFQSLIRSVRSCAVILKSGVCIGRAWHR